LSEQSTGEKCFNWNERHQETTSPREDLSSLW
jgi:hypothetical protein